MSIKALAKALVVVLGAGCLVLGACSGIQVPRSGFQVPRSLNPELRTQNQNPGTRNPEPGTAASTTPARALVTQYCITCHNDKLKTANLILNRADAEQVSNSMETWEKVIVQLRSRAMPPPGIRRPDNATYDNVASWLETELDRAAAARPNPGRPADLHRLNRTEYANAIRDLLGVEIDGALILPPDEQSQGFDTNADALTVVPALLDRYLTAAGKISRLAIGDPTVRPVFERYAAVKNNPNERTQLWQTERLGEEFPLGSRGGVAARHYFPVDGEYVLRVLLERTIDGPIHGLNVPNVIEIRIDDARVGQFKVGGSADVRAPAARTTVSDSQYANDPSANASDALEVRVPVKAGLRQVVVTILKSEAAKPEGLGLARIPIWSEAYGEDMNVQLVVPLLLIGGPYNAQVPQDSPSRRRIFVCYPDSKNDETACATKILSTLARRAYRRPTTSEDVQTLLGFFNRGRAARNFETGIRVALERVLVSPDFLFRIEADPEKIAPGTAYRVSDVELASRLSFFLWSSIPDDELLDLAIGGRLRDSKIFEQQVRRMLADPRARTALVGSFFSQWLQIRNVWLLTPDFNKKFPWFDDNLRIAFVKEIELFLESQLREDRSVVDLLTADYTFLNEQLARHYGISDVYGSHFRRVQLADDHRRGLLGKASILAVTAYPHRTSPTIRGKWLFENLLAAPVPPPPPDVNTTLEEEKTVKTASIREMLERHRSNAACASCHARMDPLGFALENFDALGRWRTTDGDVAIDATGVLLDGTKVDGPASLRGALVQRKEQFVKAVTAKLLMYGLGREIDYSDTPAIRGIMRSASADNYRWSSTILAIVKSTPFQMRRSKS
jgi:mono/diheme cytochrome c family protein